MQNSRRGAVLGLSRSALHGVQVPFPMGVRGMLPSSFVGGIPEGPGAIRAQPAAVAAHAEKLPQLECGVARVAFAPQRVEALVRAAGAGSGGGEERRQGDGAVWLPCRVRGARRAMAVPLARGAQSP